jgi:hypothetical protein
MQEVFATFSFCLILAGFLRNQRRTTAMIHNLGYSESSSSLSHIADTWHALGGPADRTAALRELLGPAPLAFEKPPYGTPQYALALRCGWISFEEHQADRAVVEERRKRSLQTCHRHSLYEKPRSPTPKETGAYVPELAARIEDDPNLTDGARRCARKLAEYTYRHARARRSSEITVTYLMQALGKCRRTVQHYLRLLEREGYISVDVIQSNATRMCTGLLVHLLRPLFPRHHRKQWPQTLANPGVQKNSLKNRTDILNKGIHPRIPRRLWALKCMDGVFKSLTKTLPLFSEPLAMSA